MSETLSVAPFTQEQPERHEVAIGSVPWQHFVARWCVTGNLETVLKTARRERLMDPHDGASRDVVGCENVKFKGSPQSQVPKLLALHARGF